MARQDNLHTGEAARQAANQKRLAFGSPGENSSIDRGRFRVGGSAQILIDGSGGMVVHGTFNGDGTITWTGISNLNGTNNLNGTTNLNGPWKLVGNGDVTGNVTQTGDYTVSPTGKITISGSAPVVLGVVGGVPTVQVGSGKLVSVAGGMSMLASGGGISVGATAAYMNAGGNEVKVSATNTQVTGPMAVVGAFTATSKSFKIPHPLKADTWLLHGVTESNEHGVEYRGDGVIDDNGSAVVTLPDYFEALTEPGATIFVIGNGFCAGWSPIENNSLTVAGEPGGSFSWLVKAARSDVTLVTEEPMGLVADPEQSA